MKSKNNLGSSVKYSIIAIGLTVIGLVLKELSNIFVPFVIAYFLFLFLHHSIHWLKRIKIPLFAVILVDI